MIWNVPWDVKKSASTWKNVSISVACCRHASTFQHSRKKTREKKETNTRAQEEGNKTHVYFYFFKKKYKKIQRPNQWCELCVSCFEQPPPRFLNNKKKQSSLFGRAWVEPPPGLFSVDNIHDPSHGCLWGVVRSVVLCSDYSWRESDRLLVLPPLLYVFLG